MYKCVRARKLDSSSTNSKSIGMNYTLFQLDLQFNRTDHQLFKDPHWFVKDYLKQLIEL